MIYRYYSTERPVAPGTFPNHGVLRIMNFETRQKFGDIKAWGYIDYEVELTEKEKRDYELYEQSRAKKIRESEIQGTYSYS